MATLTQTSLFSRKVIALLIIGLIVLTSLIVFLGLGKSLIKLISPPSPPPATVAFGKLPSLDLSEGIKPPPGTTYTIDTISGNLPQLPASVKVFGIAQKEVAFGDLERIRERAIGAGYTKEPAEITRETVKFVHPSESDKILTIERLSGNFTLKSDYFTNVHIISTRPSSVEAAIRTSENFFKNMNVQLQEFPLDKIVTRKLRIDGNSLTETQSLASTNLIEVIFTRGDLDKLAVIWPRHDVVGISALIAENGVVAATYNVSQLEKYRFATYPLKGTRRAYEDLKAGLGAFNGKLLRNNFSIIDVSLGYVESEKNNSYLQPVYFFKGLDDVIAYVPAVDDAWTSK